MMKFCLNKMPKGLVSIFFSIFLCSASLFAAESDEAVKLFVKGSIADKIAVVRNSTGRESIVLSERGIDFSIENAYILKNDRDLSALAVASVLALSKDSSFSEEESVRFCNKLISVFKSFDDDNVRIAALDRIVVFSGGVGHDAVVSLINSFVKDAVGTVDKVSPVIASAVTSLGKIGDAESFSIIYGAWSSNKWEQYRNELSLAVIDLSQKYPDAAKKTVLSSSVEEISEYFDLIEKKDTIPENFKAEIAENVLLKTINNKENLQNASSGEAVAKRDTFVQLQLKSLAVIADNRWSKASKLVGQYFVLAKKMYADKILNDNEFIAVITNTAKIASQDSAQCLSDCLADFNRSLENSVAPVKSVVLAVISALGGLGDKTAFDNLLYVTYLEYPEEVVSEARDALAKLKW